MKALLWRALIVALFVIFIAYWLLVILVPRIKTLGGESPHKVYVTFGFHTNLYHSYRIDTNDEAGFGKDIRIIRRIIEVLDEHNEKGTPVKAHWDIENLFSLQETLPEYAPDIIEDIRRRVKENGDDIVLMSYNNGLMSAMNEEEFRAAMERAITNPARSGNQDVFGEWSPIARPQEMMATPGTYDLYKQLGVNALIFYYSAITFDTFRVFERELTLEEAHNPLLYKHPDTGEEIIVMPAYNVGDLIENVSLKRWVRTLRRAQLSGEIDRDVLITLNFDADDEYWYGYKLPSHLKWLPNTGGLEQLLQELAGLDYVEFTTVTEYLNQHDPAGEITFGQDPADGSFNGYSSWAEKATTQDYWTRLTASRRVEELAENLYGGNVPGGLAQTLKQLFEVRLRLLSTTNFGMATPYLARAREQVVRKLVDNMDALTARARAQLETAARGRSAGAVPGRDLPGDAERIDSFSFTRAEPRFNRDNPDNGFSGQTGGAVITLSVTKFPDDERDYLVTDEQGNALRTYTLLTTDDRAKLYIAPASDDNVLRDGRYSLYLAPRESSVAVTAAKDHLRNEFVEILLNEHGHVQAVNARMDEGLPYLPRLEAGSLIPAITYDRRRFAPENLKVSVEQDGTRGVATVRLTGEFPLPGIDGSKAGRIDYRISLVEDVPYVFVEGGILYPETVREDYVKLEQASLTRKLDRKWDEVMPAPLRFAVPASTDKPFRVLKRNYLGTESSYTVDYFKHSDANLNLANINNHITAEYAAVSAETLGVAVAMDTTVQANFAFAPMQQVKPSVFDDRLKIRINPFGAHFGDQYYQPTWGNRQGFQAAFISGNQYASSAPTWNGFQHPFSLMIAFFEPGRGKPNPGANQERVILPQDVRNDLVTFARPPLTATSTRGTATPITVSFAQELAAPGGFLAANDASGVYFHWEQAAGEPTAYRVSLGPAQGEYHHEYEATDTTLFLNEIAAGEPFEAGKTYHAAVKSLGTKNGAKTAESDFSREYVFTYQPPSSEKKGPKVPLSLQLKILWYALRSNID